MDKRADQERAIIDAIVALRDTPRRQTVSVEEWLDSRGTLLRMIEQARGAETE